MKDLLYFYKISSHVCATTLLPLNGERIFGLNLKVYLLCARILEKSWEGTLKSLDSLGRSLVEAR